MSDDERVDEAFTLRGNVMLHDYVRNQRQMNVCYAYSTTEAIAALYAKEFNRPPIELSIQQVADYVPIHFNYEEKRNRKDTTECYFGSHIHALQYAKNFGLCTALDYPNRGNRNTTQIPAIPNDWVRYKIWDFRRVRMENTRFKRDIEEIVTEEAIYEILEDQPMVGAVRIYQSFLDFRGQGVYTGCTGPDDADLNAAHSMLIIGFGVMNGIKYFEVKNSVGTNWGDNGYGKVSQELVYRMAYPTSAYREPFEQ